MPFRDRLRSRALRFASLTKLLPHVPEMRRGGHASGGLLLERNADRDPDGAAVLFGSERWSWSDLERAANRWARLLLGRGIAHGDVVSLVMDNRPEYLAVLMGAAKVRAVVACVNTNLSGAALTHVLRAAGGRVIVAGSEHEAAVTAVVRALSEEGSNARLLVHEDHGSPAVRPPVNAELASFDGKRIPRLRPNTEDAMTYLYTSGTTGLPKAAIVTNQRFMTAAYGFGKLLHRAGPSDVIYVPLPLYHGTAQWGGFGASLATGAAVALRRKFSASQFWADAVRFGATRFMYIGELCRYLLQQPESEEERQHRIEVAVGNGLRPDVWEQFQARFRIPTIREFYGATEGNAPLANLEGRPGMLGLLGYGQAILRCNQTTGEVVRDAKGLAEQVTAPGEKGLFVARISRVATFDGYVDKDASEKKVLRDVVKKGDTWFDTGDLVTLHEDGWVSFADRVGDTFRWKGENVSTSEVALHLNECPGVLESNVYGVPVPGADGRAGMASLRVSDAFDVDEFRTAAERRLPKYAQPIFLRIQKEMNVTSTLKQVKTDYRKEGYDPHVVKDPLYALVGNRYVEVDAALHARLASGELTVG